MALVALLLLMASEVWLLIQVGSATSPLLVVAWVVAAFAIGLSLMRRAAARATELAHHAGEQVSTVMTPLGLLVMRREQKVSRVEVFDAMGLVFAGFLFVLPGLVSDVFGLALCVPAVRRHFVARVLAIGRPQPVRQGGTDTPNTAQRAGSARRTRPASTDVEVLPPGSLPHSPLRKRPVVIDVD